MLFTEFNTNYSKLPAIFRKGSVLLRENVPKDMDKDAIIPTLPEALPGSTSAEATPSALSTTAIASESLSDPTSELASDATGPTSSASSTVAKTSTKKTQQDAVSDKKRQSQDEEEEEEDTQEEIGGKDAEDKVEIMDIVEKPAFKRIKKGVVIDHIDIIGEKFWTGRGAYILASEKKKKTSK